MSGNIQELLKELQRDYLQSIPEKIVNIQKLWIQSHLEDLETEYHKLKGTGRTYGLPEITQIGEALETLCQTAPKTLPQAVPLSLTLLERVREARSRGASVPLDDDADFRVLIDLLKTP